MSNRSKREARMAFIEHCERRLEELQRMGAEKKRPDILNRCIEEYSNLLNGRVDWWKTRGQGNRA